MQCVASRNDRYNYWVGVTCTKSWYGTRRLHDIGRSGWWQLVALIPILGWILLIVWLAQETAPADNMYGAPAKPKMEGAVSPVTPEAPVATAAAIAPVATADETAPVADTAPVTPDQQS